MFRGLNSHHKVTKKKIYQHKKGQLYRPFLENLFQKEKQYIQNTLGIILLTTNLTNALIDHLLLHRLT